MPRGGRPKARTTRNEAPERKTRRSAAKAKTVTEVRRGPPRGSKKMDNASEKSESRKRKQTAVAAGESFKKWGQSSMHLLYISLYPSSFMIVPVKKVKVVTNGGPPAKKAKITATKEEPAPALAVEGKSYPQVSAQSFVRNCLCCSVEPDRAVEAQANPAKSKGHGKDKTKVRKISPAVPKTQEEAPAMTTPLDKETVSHQSHRKQAGQVRDEDDARKVVGVSNLMSHCCNQGLIESQGTRGHATLHVYRQ